MPTARKAAIAPGYIHSTTLHKFGTNTAPRTKATLMVIARVSGTAMRLISALEVSSFL